MGHVFEYVHLLGIKRLLPCLIKSFKYVQKDSTSAMTLS